MPSRLCAAARVLLAVLMLIGGAVNMVAYALDPTLFPPLHPFVQLLLGSGYLLIAKLLEVAGGVLLLTRYRALGLALLWPVVVNIALYHALLDARAWLNAPILLLLAALASWPERRAFAALLQPTRSAGGLARAPRVGALATRKAD